MESNSRFWETAHLPLPKPNIFPKKEVSIYVTLGEWMVGSFQGDPER